MKRPTLSSGLLGLAGLVLFTGACGPAVSHVDGEAAPVTASPVPSFPPSITPASPSSAPATSAPATTASSSPPAGQPEPETTTKTTAPDKPQQSTVLGPRGLGSLRLGMSSTQASATGLVGKWTNPATGESVESGDCSVTAHLKAAPGDAGKVYSGKNLGVQVINAYGSVRTPEGIRIGSSKSALFAAYPGWKNAADEDPHADGRGLVDVPGNSKAYYRIVTLNGKVVQLALQDKHQSCYE
jgi:hypothetical protein